MTNAIVVRVVSSLDAVASESQFLRVGRRAVRLLSRLRAAGRGSDCHRVIDALSAACRRVGAD